MSHRTSTPPALIARSKPFGLVILLILPPCTHAACSQEPVFLPVGNCSLPDQPTVHSWGAPISVSSSDSSSTLQYLCAVPSTVLNTTFYTTSLLCSDAAIQSQHLTHAQCLSRRGGLLSVSDSGQPIGPDPLRTTSTSSLKTSDPGWVTIMSPDDPFPAAVTATIHLHGHDSTSMTAGLIESGTNHTTTHLSLGDKSALLSSLVAQGRIAARSFGFDAGSQSHASPRAGGLVLGGWDDGARAGTEVRFPMADYKENHQLNGKRTCPLQVTIASMVLRPAGGDGSTDYPLGIEPAHPQQACLEMYDNYPRLPRGVIDSIKDGFQLFTGSRDEPIRYPPSDPTTAQKLGDIYIPEPGLIYPSTNATATFNASLVVMLAGNNFTVEIPVEELFNPVRGIAKDGTRALNAKFSELAVYQDPAPEDAAVLGKVFLSRAYLYVDYDKQEFTLTQSATSGRTILVATGDDAGTCGGSGWSRVTIALVAVVAVLGTALLGVLACWAVRRRRRGQSMAVSKFWRRRDRVNEQPVANGRPREAYQDDLQLDDHIHDHVTARTTPPAPPAPLETDQHSQAQITHVQTGSDRTGLSNTAVQPRQLSQDSGISAYHRQRIGSVEVPGTSPLDAPYSPNGEPPQLDSRERQLAHDHYGVHELQSPTASSYRSPHLGPSTSTSPSDDPLYATRTNRSGQSQPSSRYNHYGYGG